MKDNDTHRLCLLGSFAHFLVKLGIGRALPGHIATVDKVGRRGAQ